MEADRLAVASDISASHWTVTGLDDTGADDDKPKEYVLTQQDVDNDYIETDIEDSFDGDEYEEENR